MTLNCLIIDDEQLARALIADYVAQVPQLVLCGSFGNPLMAQSILATQDIDLIFLDINMPQISGLDFLKTLRSPPNIILTTAYSDYALEAFDLAVSDYLVKPITFDRFLKAVNKVLATEAPKEIPTAPLPTSPGKESENEFIFIKADKIIHKVFIKDVLYMESLREYTRIHTAKQRIVAREALSHLTTMLPANEFIRIHRSYIINLLHVQNIEGNQVRIAGQSLPISKRKKEAFLALVEKRGLIG